MGDDDKQFTIEQLCNHWECNHLWDIGSIRTNVILKSPFTMAESLLWLVETSHVCYSACVYVWLFIVAMPSFEVVPYLHPSLSTNYRDIIGLLGKVCCEIKSQLLEFMYILVENISSLFHFQRTFL